VLLGLVPASLGRLSEVATTIAAQSLGAA